MTEDLLIIAQYGIHTRYIDILSVLEYECSKIRVISLIETHLNLAILFLWVTPFLFPIKRQSWATKARRTTILKPTISFMRTLDSTVATSSSSSHISSSSSLLASSWVQKDRCICSFLDIALYQSVRPYPSTPLTGYVQSQSTDGKRLFPGGKIYAMATREYTNCKNVSLSNITLYFRKE